MCWVRCLTCGERKNDCLTKRDRPMVMMRCADDIKPIAPILRQMQVLDICAWPINRIMVVMASVSRLHREYKDEGRRYRVEPDRRKVIVQRMK